MSKFEVETHFKIYHNNHGTAITVSPDPDGLDMVRVYTDSKIDKEHFGDFDFCVLPEIAILLGETLVEMGKKYQKPTV